MNNLIFPGWQEECDKILQKDGKFVKTEDAPEDSVSLYEDEPSGTTSNNPLKPFDNPPRSSTDLSKNYNDDEDSFRVVFEQPSEDEVSESESDGGIVFKDETPDPQILKKPAPSR